MTSTTPVADPSDPRAQRIADLAKPSHSNSRTALIEDPETLTHCLESGVEFVEVYHQSDRTPPSELVELCARRRVPLTPVEVGIVGRAFKGERKPHVFGIAQVPRPLPLARLLDGPGDIVVLDGVRITGNIGAIIRSATALGAAGVVLLDSGLSSLADRRLLRASRGHVFSIPVVLATPSQLTSFLRDNAIPVAVFEASAATPLSEFAATPDRWAMVFGSERSGPSSPVGDRTEPVVVPMARSVESLNVSVCAAIVLYARHAANGSGLSGAGPLP
jgi:TrmH family RNA methyltransferase